MTANLRELEIDDPAFPDKISDIMKQRLAEVDAKSQLEELLGYDRSETEQPDVAIEEVITSLTSIIYTTAAIAQSRANETKANVLSQLREIEANPQALYQNPGLSGEVVGTIAPHYQRKDEEPGKFWMDISEGGAAPDRIEEAARQAAEGLEREKRLKRKNLSIVYLTLALRIEFIRHGHEVTRAVDPMHQSFRPVSRFSRLVDLVGKDLFEWARTKKVSIPCNTDRIARNASDRNWVLEHSAWFPEFNKHKI